MEPNRLSDEASPNARKALGDSSGVRLPAARSSGSPIGRAAVGLCLVALGGIGVYLTAMGSGLDPNDPGTAQVGLIISPLLAFGAALVLGVLLVVLAAFGLVAITVRRAILALVLGLVGGPICYVILLFVLAAGLSSLPGQQLLIAVLIFMLPIACGIGVTSLVAFRGRSRRPTASPPGPA